MRIMLRHNLPGVVNTGVHYNKLSLRGGDAYLLTAWVPIGKPDQVRTVAPFTRPEICTGDCPVRCGGLIYLKNSSQIGLQTANESHCKAADLPEAERISAFNQFMGKFGQLSNDAGDFPSKHGSHRRLASNFEADDVVSHDPYAIYASSFNEDPSGKIRFSCDSRFYETGSALDERWMKLWTPGDRL